MLYYSLLMFNYSKWEKITPETTINIDKLYFSSKHFSVMKYERGKCPKVCLVLIFQGRVQKVVVVFTAAYTALTIQQTVCTAVNTVPIPRYTPTQHLEVQSQTRKDSVTR